MKTIIRGSILKGKTKKLFRIIVVALSLITAVFCVGINLNRTDSKIYAVTYAGEDYSQRDENNIILSVEKVGVISTGEDHTSDDVFQSELTNTSNSIKKMPTLGGDYYYQNIANGTSNKYVIESGSFVMLNNTTYAQNDTTYYRNTSMSGSIVESEGNRDVNMAEAIMITFGTYYFEDNNNNNSLTVSESEGNEGSQLTYVNVRATRNGEDISSEFGIRNYGSSNSYVDISYIIPQKSGYEGYYTLDFEYFYNGVIYNQSFNFYLIFASSYNDSVTYGANIYSVNPSLRAGNDNLPIVGATNQYMLGSTSTNYPMLTYDYTKYSMSYTHTLNGRVTTYRYYIATTTNLSGTSATLRCDITTSGQTSTKDYGTLSYYKHTNGARNILTLVFTEIGNYNFSFDYIYAGYNSENAPEMNLTIPNINLDIHGFELKYSKANYVEAQMRYLLISKGNGDEVDVIVPNGYVYGSNPTESALGVAYTLVNNAAKVGTTVESTDALENNNRTLDANINNKVKDYLSFTIYSENKSNIYNITNAISTEDYVKTNQGSLWLSTTDAYTPTGGNELGSFYFYSQSIIKFDSASDITIQDTTGEISFSEKFANVVTYNKYSNQTSFNRTGYYLVFIKVDLNDSLNSNKIDDYYQVYAFRFVSETVQVDLRLENQNLLGDNGFTGDDVTVSWAKEGVFERTISARYYSVKNQFYSTNELMNTTAYPLNNGQTLGGNISIGEGANFLIEIISEGEGRSYHLFTIDRQPITGVNAYEVEMNTSLTSTTITYGFASSNGRYNTIDNSISDSLSALFWNDKPSGAKITATYTLTPFVVDNNIAPSVVRTTASEEWYSTNYKLGTTVGPFKYNRASALGADINYSSILQRAGIYIFTLTDEAGNSCKYLFVYDDSENYFNVQDANGDSSMRTRQSLIFADDVRLTVGTHKVISLYNNTDISSLNSDLLTLVNFASTNAGISSYEQAGYYIGTSNNINAINSLFSLVGNDIYLTVKNESLSVYSNTGLVSQITNISINNRSVTISGNTNTASTLRNIYVVANNQRDKEARESDSFMTIEINTDNSRGMAFYSNDSFGINDFDPNAVVSGGNIVRLYYEGTGNKSDGMIGTHATSDNYLAFTWYNGSGDYEVESVYYDFYELDMSGNSYTSDYYHYDLAESAIYLYENGEVKNSAELNIDGTRGFALLNVISNQTRDGLYIVTRTYSNGESLKYYYIVDRNGIINSDLTTNRINGSMISIGLKENETTFNTFTGINMTQSSFIDNENNGQQVFYYNYLTTDKMPAVLNIPIGKYFYNGQGSNYDAGRLKFTLYFVDRQNQIDGRAHIVFEIDSMTSADRDNYVFENGVATYYKIDLTKYLEENSAYAGVLLSKLVRVDNDGSWLCLPGDYVVVISDMVESSSSRINSRTFGFSIQPTTPNVDIYAVNDKEDSIDEATQILTNDSLTTSADYVKIELPKYDKDSTSAGIDIDYVVISRSINGRTPTFYINYPYTTGNININDDEANSAYVKNNRENGVIVSRTLYLDHSNFAPSDSIVYTITIRYDLGNASANDAYVNAYYSFINSENSQPTNYYEKTYNVVVDRVPPSANINRLERSDILVDYFNDENETDGLFESATLNEASGKYYVNRYNAYYNNGLSKSDLYAFRVNADTAFDTEDVAYVYYSDPIRNLNEVSMSLPYYTGYNGGSISSNINRYGSILSNDYNGQYAVIVEMDRAGNATQYVVHYFVEDNDNDTALVLNFKVSNLSDEGIIDNNGTLTINTKQSNNDRFTIFSIADLGLESDDVFTMNENSDVFFRFEFENINTGDKQVISTNATTSFTNAGLGTQLVNMIKSAGQGNYMLTIYTRTNTYVAYINYYPDQQIINLNIEELIEERADGTYVINLAGANVTVNGYVYYADSITIENGTDSATYICDPSNNYSYYLQGNDTNITYTTIALDENSTYRITMVDAFGRTQIRNLSTSGRDFYSIDFEGSSEKNYYTASYGSGVAYYSYNTAIVNFDNTLYDAMLTLTINGAPINIGTSNEISYNGQVVANFFRDTGIIKIYPYWGEENGGAIIQATVTINATDNSETVVYNIFIDSESEAVAIRDMNSNSQTIVPVVNSNVEDTVITNSFVGSMTLVLRPIEREYYQYSYILHRYLDNGVIDNIELNNTTRITLSESGTYRLELKYFTADGYYLGNKVYTFAIHIVSGQLYYVEGIAGPNSSFTFAEIIGSNANTGITLESLSSAFNMTVEELNVYLNYSNELYISNKDLIVSEATDQGAKKLSISCDYNNGYKFTIYRVYTSTYSQFIATLKTPNDEMLSNSLISDLTLTKTYTNQETNQQIEEVLSLNVSGENIFYGEPTSKFVLSFNQIIASNSQNLITRKNSLLLEVWYNDSYVDTIELLNNGTPMTYTVKGDGYYSFKFLDLAGNTHLFTGTNLLKDSIDIAILREVVLTMNNEQIVDYAYLNGDVVISAYNSIVYNGTLSIESCTLNGESYSPTRAQNTYTFSGFGTFRVKFRAEISDENGVHELTKTIVFTIINPNEARTSIDLTNLANYKIIKVTNNSNKDITKEFNSIINKANGMSLTYEQVIENKDLFQVTSGKQTFNITYLVNDGIYPEREITFAFTLNNDNPYIECSLSAGETTKDSFTISFNAGIIYSQVGDSYLYVNNILVATIDENSATEITTRTFSNRDDGYGDYYISLVSSSGNVISSFKVTIEEPLNVWAIIIIVVVSIIVVTVVTVIIVLRNKMRIR